MTLPTMAGTSPYAMSKHAVEALCSALHLELARDGISVTHVAPGFVETEIRQVDNQGALRDTWSDAPLHFGDLHEDRTPVALRGA